VMPRHCRTVNRRSFLHPEGFTITICGDFPIHRCRCGGEGLYQCDYPTVPGNTCDAYLCQHCRRPQTPTGKDFCPKHDEVVMEAGR